MLQKSDKSEQQNRPIWGNFYQLRCNICFLLAFKVTKITISTKIYPIWNKKMHYLCKRKKKASTTLVQLLTTKLLRLWIAFLKLQTQ